MPLEVRPFPDDRTAAFWKDLALSDRLFRVQERKVHRVSGFLSSVVHGVERLWDRNTAPYRVLLRTEAQHVVARAGSSQAIYADLTLLRELSADVDPPAPGAALAAELAAAVLDRVRAAAERGGGGGGSPAKRPERAPPAAAARPARPAAPSAAAAPPADPEAVVDAVWESFFNRSYAVGADAVRSGLLPVADLEDRESYLYIGLPSLGVLTAWQSSLDSDGIQLATGQVVTEARCPREHLPLYQRLVQGKALLEEAKANEQEMAALRRVVLFAASERAAPEPALGDERRRAQLMAVAAAAQAVATLVSQMKAYQARFDRVLAALLVEARRAAVAASERAEDERARPAREEGSEDAIWTSFFNRAFEVGEAAVRARLLPVDDLECEEAYLFIGLPSLTILEALHRSLPLDDGVELATGAVVTRASCPPQHAELLRALLDAKAQLRAAAASPAELQALRRVVLFAASPSAREEALGDEGRRRQLMAVAAAVQALGTLVSQMPFYKARFNQVVALLASGAARPERLVWRLTNGEEPGASL